MRVLVVDPSAGLRHILSEELEDAGFSTAVAEWPDDAMALALADPPDAIVLNATMAPASGARFIHDLRADIRTAMVPVVAISARRGSEQPLLDAGADYCLQRVPVSGEVLRAVQWVVTAYGKGQDP